MAQQIGRNDPCPCGSGLKFKHCHLNRADATPIDNLNDLIHKASEAVAS